MEYELRKSHSMLSEAGRVGPPENHVYFTSTSLSSCTSLKLPGGAQSASSTVALFLASKVDGRTSAHREAGYCAT